MSVPSTPRKKGEEINRIAYELNARWGISLPIKRMEESPSKGQDRMEEQIYQRIRYLYFRNEAALVKALSRFESLAGSVASGWKFKPGADLDTLPSGSNEEFHLRRRSVQQLPELSSKHVQQLTTALLRLLSEASAPTVPVSHVPRSDNPG